MCACHVCLPCVLAMCACHVCLPCVLAICSQARSVQFNQWYYYYIILPQVFFLGGFDHHSNPKFKQTNSLIRTADSSCARHRAIKAEQPGARSATLATMATLAVVEVRVRGAVALVTARELVARGRRCGQTPARASPTPITSPVLITNRPGAGRAADRRAGHLRGSPARH